MSLKKKFKSFRQARDFARKLNFKTQSEWRCYVNNSIPAKGKKPADIPPYPDYFYKSRGWIHWGNWLGTRDGTFKNRKWLPFNRARAFARRTGISTRRQWNEYSKGELPDKGIRPWDIPADPRYVYRDKGWNGWDDWLGKSKRKSV